jgi:hypothetical protein
LDPKLLFPMLSYLMAARKQNQPDFPAILYPVICMHSFSYDRGASFQHDLPHRSTWCWARHAVEVSYLSDCSALSHGTVHQTRSSDPRWYGLCKLSSKRLGSVSIVNGCKEFQYHKPVGVESNDGLLVPADADEAHQHY